MGLNFLEKLLKTLEEKYKPFFEDVKAFTDKGGRGHIILKKRTGVQSQPGGLGVPVFRPPTESSKNLEKAVKHLREQLEGFREFSGEFSGLHAKRIELEKHPWAFHVTRKKSETREKPGKRVEKPVGKPVVVYDIFSGNKKILTVIPVLDGKVWRHGHFVIHDAEQGELVKKIISKILGFKPQILGFKPRKT